MLLNNSNENLEKRFKENRDKWLLETGTCSIRHDSYLHPSYLSIIGMGENAIPFIIKDIKEKGKTGCNWIHAFQSITQIKFPKETDTLEKAQEFILKWAEDNLLD